MGVADSKALLSDYLDENTVRTLAGDYFDKKLFDTLADDDVVGFRFCVFVHYRVGIVNAPIAIQCSAGF